MADQLTEEQIAEFKVSFDFSSRSLSLTFTLSYFSHSLSLRFFPTPHDTVVLFLTPPTFICTFHTFPRIFSFFSHCPRCEILKAKKCVCGSFLQAS